jgi:hypothetical protein
LYEVKTALGDYGENASTFKGSPQGFIEMIGLEIQFQD